MSIVFLYFNPHPMLTLTCVNIYFIITIHSFKIN